MKETKLFELMTGTETKPWLSRNMSPNINTCENGLSNFSANLRVVSLNLLELTQFAWPNLSIYFNFLCAVPRDVIIESTRFLMRPPVIIPPWVWPFWNQIECEWDQDYYSLQVTRNASLYWRSLMTLLYWEWHLIPRWPLRSIFARFTEQLLKDLVSWRSHGECSMINRFLGDAFRVLSCPFWSTVRQCVARLTIHTLNYWTVQSGVPVSYWVCIWVWHCISSICGSTVYAVSDEV